VSEKGLQKKSKIKKSEGLWLTSFADMSLILMSFFALQLSFSKPQVDKFDNVTSNMLAKKPPEKKKKKVQEPVKENNLQTMQDELMVEIKKSKLEEVATVKLDAEGLAIEFKDKLLFSPGSAESNPNFAKVSDQVMGVIAKSPSRYKITIEGHTDDTPMGTRGKYKSNWELSAARGVTLLNQFKTRGVQTDRMRVIAYAETRPKVPVTELTGPELDTARAANRRVVIRLE